MAENTTYFELVVAQRALLLDSEDALQDPETGLHRVRAGAGTGPAPVPDRRDVCRDPGPKPDRYRTWPRGSPAL
jgi:hypothetical protein